MTITAANYTDHIEFDTCNQWLWRELCVVEVTDHLYWIEDREYLNNTIEYHMAHANHNLAVSV